jgi:predicted acetyltransferase
VRDSFLQAARDLCEEGWLPQFPVDKVAAGFDGYVKRAGADDHAWGVPVTTLWYVEGATYLGTVIIRHRLTPQLAQNGGHIGYHVAPATGAGGTPQPCWRQRSLTARTSLGSPRSW